MDEQSDLFSQLFVRCLECDEKNTDLEVEVIIDKLLKLDYSKRIFAITTRIAGEVLCHFATHTSIFKTRNEFLLNKYFQLVTQLTSSQEIILEPSAVNELLSKVTTVWSYCLNDQTSIQALLDAVAAVTYQNGPYISSENISFLLQTEKDSLLEIVRSKSGNLDIRRKSVQCITGLCAMCDNGDRMPDDMMAICIKFFISELQEFTVNPPHTVPTCRIIFALAKGLHNILSSSSDVHLPNIGPLLAVLKKFMVYGLPGLSDTAPDELQPVPVPELRPVKQGEENKQSDTQPPTPQPKSHTKKKKRKSKSKFREPSQGDVSAAVQQMTLDQGQTSGFKGYTGQFRPAWARVTSSESEYSDTEGAQKAKLRSFLNKIRQMCLSVLYLTVKRTDKHTMLGYWSSFLPESPSVLANSASLFTSFKKDMAPKCRAAALGVVSAMLEGSRWYLAFAAEETGSPSQQTSSFVPFSVSLAASIREIHKQLLSASSKEQSTMALTQLLKTLSTLVLNTPYQKMKPGLLVRVSSQARYFLSTSRDTNVKIGCMGLLGSVSSTSAPLAEVANILSDSTPPPAVGIRPLSGNHTPVEHKSIPEHTEASDHGSWLVDQCIALIKQGRKSPSSTQFFEPELAEMPFSLRTEALQTLTKITKGYLPVVKKYIGAIGEVISSCLEDQATPVRINAGKLLEELGASVLAMVKSSPSKTIEDESLSLWTKVLGGPLQNAMQDHTCPALQGKGCDSLSTISPAVFVKLPHSLQIMCQTLLLGFTSDENAVVRAPAVRALGVYVMFPSLREDIAFLEDVTAAVLRLLEDPLLIVRANAAWSLGNLTDTLVINKEIRPHSKDEFQSSLLLDVFNKAMKATSDKVKVVFNMMRVLGNLLRYADASHIEDTKFKSLMLEATHILSQMVAGDIMVKIRWNACTACSNFLRNKSLPLSETEWSDHVYQALCDSVGSCKNFKVRIKAALALSTPTKREHYGSKFSDVFTCLVQGFEDSNMAADFTEFKFKDTLQEQLCTTLIHLATLVRLDDIQPACSSLSGKCEEINQHLSTYWMKLSRKLESDRDLPSARNALGQSSVLNDPIEEYIVAKQLTTQQKMDVLNVAINHINSLAATHDQNENSVQSEEKGDVKGRADPSILTQVFSLSEVL